MGFRVIVAPHRGRALAREVDEGVGTGRIVVCLLLIVIASSYVHSRTPGTRTSVLDYQLPKVAVAADPVVGGGSMALFIAPKAGVSTLTPRFALASKTAVAPTDNARHGFGSPRRCRIATTSKV